MFVWNSFFPSSSALRPHVHPPDSVMLSMSNGPCSLRAHQVIQQSNLVCLTGLLPVFASLCIYCLWPEIKRSRAARLGTPGETLTDNAGGFLPNAHTQERHQNSSALLPPSLKVMNRKKCIFSSLFHVSTYCFYIFFLFFSMQGHVH